MKKTRYTEEQIAFALKQAETGTRVGEVCRKMGISEATFYIYGLPPFCKYRIWFWVVAYIYPASGKSVPKWVIRTQSPQQLDGL
ncbi:Transposase [Cedecea lapagei]|uniref:Transposase n=14 Tax=Enterobacteriaceae TaxID=543 RepID=A0A3S4J0W2_9ENTR|nr:Transposase [Cedecea lapagei]